MSAPTPAEDWLEKKWQSRKWRGFVGLELALMVMAAAAWLYQPEPVSQQAVFAIWSEYAFKVFCAYIVGNVGAIVASGFQITHREK